MLGQVEEVGLFLPGDAGGFDGLGVAVFKEVDHTLGGGAAAGELVAQSLEENAGNDGRDLLGEDRAAEGDEVVFAPLQGAGAVFGDDFFQHGVDAAKMATTGFPIGERGGCLGR